MVACLVGKFERVGVWAAEVAIADAAALNLAAFRSSKKSLLRANTGFRREGTKPLMSAVHRLGTGAPAGGGTPFGM